MSATQIPTDPFTQRLQQIRQRIAEGQLREAAQALNEVQKQHPTDPRIALLGMRLADKAGNPTAAIQAARKALELSPDWHVTLVELAKLLAEQDQRDEAMKLIRRAIDMEPFDTDVRVAAINVAARAGQPDQALTWARQGVQNHPDHLGMQLYLAQALLERREFAEARTHFEAIQQRQPQSIDALLGRMACERAIGSPERLRLLADQALAAQPGDANVRFWHDLAHGRTPATRPDSAITTLFDSYAPDFDMHMVAGLKYQLPRRIAELLVQTWPDRRFNLLDLGCGTGLLGLYLGPVEGRIIGVELSQKMIDRATRHGVYSRFHRVNLRDALAATPADHYEAIACADVLPYVGDLTSVIPNALRVLKPGGLFVFSCEAAGEDEADLVLRPASLRYAHKASAVQRACEAAGFTGITVEDLPALHLEGEQPLPGFLVTARKPAAA